MCSLEVKLKVAGEKCTFYIFSYTIIRRIYRQNATIEKRKNAESGIFKRNVYVEISSLNRLSTKY